MSAAGASFLMPTYSPADVIFVRGQGSELFDDGGRRYLDFLSGIAVTSLGHAHPAVADALCRQSRQLLHVSNLFKNALAEGVAERIDRLVGDGEPAGGSVFFANSGAEANECAFKLSRRHGGLGRYAVISAYGSFHGRTLASLHATGQPHKHEGFQPLPQGFRHVAYDDLAALERAIDPDVVAAVLLESIQGEGGVVEPSPGYLQAVRRLCDERNVLMIVDEVQTGLGRTGRWFGFQHHDVTPDVVTMAKALGNGVPIGACWARRDVAAAFEPGDHATTFGGQPLACAAAATTLDVMVAEDVPGRARRAGARLGGLLSELAGITEVRGRGLLIAAVLEEPLVAGRVTAEALSRGLVVNAVTPSALRLAPSLLVTDAEIDEAASILGGALEHELAGTR